MTVTKIVTNDVASANSLLLLFFIYTLLCGRLFYILKRKLKFMTFVTFVTVTTKKDTLYI